MEAKKTRYADIDNIVIRWGMIIMGSVVVMGMTLAMIEYTSIVPPGTSLSSGLTDLADEEIVEISSNTPPPPPPPPPPPAPPEEVEVLEEDDEREETVMTVIDQETETVTIIDVVEEEEVIEVEEIFEFVEQQPEFPGGAGEMYNFLGKEVKYPEMAREAGIQGKVYVKFVVNKDGSIGEAKVIRGVHPTLDKEAVRAVKKMPKWTAGEQRGKKVSVWFTLPVNFRIG